MVQNTRFLIGYKLLLALLRHNFEGIKVLIQLRYNYEHHLIICCVLRATHKMDKAKAPFRVRYFDLACGPPHMINKTR